MKAHGHLLGRFIQEKTGELTTFFVTEGLIALILVLEGIDLALFWVAFSTPFLIFLVFQVLAYIKFMRLHQFLTAVDVTTLPDFPDSSRIGEDYQALIFELNDSSQKKYQTLADFDKDLLDLTKLWTHQMKVPLSALDLMVQTDRLTNHDVENQVVELDNYITILLSYLRLQHTATDFRFEAFDVADLVHVIIKKYANQFILKDLSVSVIGSWQITSD
ncbi:MAG: HAMP domain-containing histidine kinase, partial [Lactococcus sp.]|nr:HAMP domain-containing histidine kinase [Lactococcus sp.]